MTSGGSAYLRALDQVGTAIITEVWPAGHTTTVDGLVETTGVSRTIVREVTRELVAAGLLAASPRVGLRIRPRSEWDLLDVRVVRWRLRFGDRSRQLQELRELRAAVEPEAAALAAVRRPAGPVAKLTCAAAELERAQGDSAFLLADQRFHRALIEAAGNGMLAVLSNLIGAALEERALVERAGKAASDADVRLHVEAAASVQAGRANKARTALREIIERTHQP